MVEDILTLHEWAIYRQAIAHLIAHLIPYSNGGSGGLLSIFVFAMKTSTGMGVFNSQLYAGTAKIGAGGEVWRYDGTNWAQVNTDGFGIAANTAIRGFVVYNNQLYTTTSNSGGTEVWRYDGVNWSKANSNGFGDVNNTQSLNMAVLNGLLYATSDNGSVGAQVWRYDGVNWTQVNSNGFGDANNAGTRGMTVFNNHLYVGTYNPTTGGELWVMDEEVAPPASIPTMNEWGMMILMVLLGAGAVYYLRRLKLGA